jgi:hypothetical protein
MEITISEIKLFQILKERLGEKEAEALVTFVETKVKQESEHNLRVLATKEDVAKSETKLFGEIKETKADMIKWMFIFWMGSITVLSAIMFVMFHTFIK